MPNLEELLGLNDKFREELTLVITAHGSRQQNPSN